jgi:hypothetical protein
MGNDLNQFNRDYELDRLKERVNQLERFFETFDIEVVSPVDTTTDTMRVKRIKTVLGKVEQTPSRNISSVPTGYSPQTIIVCIDDTEYYMDVLGTEPYS